MAHTKKSRTYEICLLFFLPLPTCFRSSRFFFWQELKERISNDLTRTLFPLSFKGSRDSWGAYLSGRRRQCSDCGQSWTGHDWRIFLHGHQWGRGIVGSGQSQTNLWGKTNNQRFGAKIQKSIVIYCVRKYGTIAPLIDSNNTVYKTLKSCFLYSSNHVQKLSPLKKGFYYKI